MDPFEQPQRPRSTPIPGMDQPLRPGPPPAPAYGPDSAPPPPPGAPPKFAPPPGGAWGPAPGGYPGMPGAYPGMPGTYPGMPAMVPGAAGWGTSAPFGRNMIRKRRPIVLFIGLMLIVGGIIAGTIGVVGIVDAVSIPEDEIAVNGIIGQPMQFERTATDPQRWTVYIVTGASGEDSTDTATGSTRCTATLSDGTTASINGARQATSVNLNGKASVGYFDAPIGPISVLCESSYGTYPVFVAEGGPRLAVSDFGFVFGGVGALVIGIILTIVGARRRWVAAPAG